VIEIPPIRAIVNEFVLHCVECPFCRITTRAQLPEGIPVSGFGPNARGIMSLFSGSHRTSRRGVQQIFKDVFDVPISVGCVQKVCESMSGGLEEPVDELAESAKHAAIGFIDDTGWWERAKKMSLWVVDAIECVVFKILPGRDHLAVQALLGERFEGSVVSDRAACYGCLSPEQRQGLEAAGAILARRTRPGAARCLIVHGL
jgi:hypothetical protein